MNISGKASKSLTFTECQMHAKLCNAGVPSCQATTDTCLWPARNWAPQQMSGRVNEQSLTHVYSHSPLAR